VQRAPKNLLCCIALYLKFLTKLPETKALDSIVVICAWPFNETGLFHQICGELQQLRLNFGLEDLCAVPETEQIPICPSGAIRTGFPCIDGQIIGIGVTEASMSIIFLLCIFIRAGPAPRRSEEPSFSILGRIRTHLHRVDFVFGVMAEFVFAREC
jgi:hypothetical protein